MAQPNPAARLAAGFADKVVISYSSDGGGGMGNSRAQVQSLLPITALSAPAPFLKWAGGKTQLLAQLDRAIPRSFKKYAEPFVGSGALFFWLRRKRGSFPAVLMDRNPELINCYSIVRDNIDGLMPLLDGLQENHCKKQYYEVRDQNPCDLDPSQRAARFIYLNKTCFNGLYRVNSEGRFNVPMGSYKRPRIYDEVVLRAASEALQGVTLLEADFADVQDHVGAGDFVYFDPPYHPISKTSSFTGYALGTHGRASFGIELQQRLARNFKLLAARECYVMLSNSDCERMRRFYRDYHIQIVAARRAINCDGTRRGTINEIVVTNYERTANRVD